MHRWTTTFAFVLFSALPLWAQSPSDYYLAQRRMYPPNPSANINRIREMGTASRGTTLEIEGILRGIVGGDDNSAILIIETRNNGTLSLPMSQPPSWIQGGNTLRVLVVATGIGTNGEVDTLPMNTPEMQIVAVASASDIAAAELRYQRSQSVKTTMANRAPIPFRTINPAGMVAMRNGISRSALASRKGSYDLRGMAAQGLSADAQAVFAAYLSYIRRCNRRLTELQASNITASILAFSEKMDVDPRLVIAMVIAESDFDPNCKSNKGAMGIAQLMPDEVQRLGLTNPYDPVQNLGGAIFLLKERLNKYSGSGDFKAASLQHIVLTLASYNAGMGAVKRYNGVPPYRETRNYVKKIEKIYRSLCQNDSDQGRFQQ